MEEIFKKIFENQEKAKTIVNNALEKADLLKQELKQKSIIENEVVYLAEITNAKRFATNLIDNCHEEVDKEVQKIKDFALKEINDLEQNAIYNIDKAVGWVVNAIYYMNVAEKNELGK